METINQNVNEEKLNKFFEQYSMPFINNAVEYGLNMNEICCAVTELFLNVFTSSELTTEGIEATEEQIQNKRAELIDDLMPFFYRRINSQR